MDLPTDMHTHLDHGETGDYIPSFTLLPSVNLAQIIVAWSQEGKCGLKYVIHSPTDK